MATYGIVIEGSYDSAAIVEIIKKCLSSEIEIIQRPCGSKSQLMRKFPGFLKEFCYVKEGTHVDKAFVIRDADTKDPVRLDRLAEEMRGKIVGRTYPFEIKFVLIVQELETWFLADEEAISRVTQLRSGRTVSRINETLESIVHPKEKLKNILSNAKVPYTAEVAREIAMESELSKIENRCPKFREFRQAVVDC
jgi:hypothetical protein